VARIPFVIAANQLVDGSACQLESNRCSSTVGSVRRLDAGQADLSVAASSVTANLIDTDQPDTHEDGDHP
jgi:hypothetical protein